MRKYLILIVMVMGFSLTACKSEKKDHNHTEEIAKTEYMCPMNCEKGKTYTEKDKKCPVCKMKLVDKKKLDLDE